MKSPVELIGLWIEATLLLFLLIALSLIICRWICRWIFRIDEIVNYLKRIADRFDPLSQDACEVCGKKYPPDKLTKIESGQKLCPQCRKAFKSK